MRYCAHCPLAATACLPAPKFSRMFVAPICGLPRGQLILAYSDRLLLAPAIALSAAALQTKPCTSCAAHAVICIGM